MNNTNTKQNVSKNQNHLLNKPHLIRKACELAFLIALVAAGAVHANASAISKTNILDQINQQRELRGLKPLKENDKLDTAATKKSEDMISRDYFEHYAHGLTPWTFIGQADYDYLYAGENLAMDFQTSEGMVRAWMSSPAHRKNILNPDYDDIGIGIVKGEFTDEAGTRETKMVTNMFGKEKPMILKFFDSVMNKLKNIF